MDNLVQSRDFDSWIGILQQIYQLRGNTQEMINKIPWDYQTWSVYYEDGLTPQKTYQIELSYQ